ncbi:IS110 family transposase [Micromonospora maris]|uniref:IS110 family transposase n=1 Tax=Micromonospora maris TaxID=1003110 RepID=UPI002E13B852|nr:IS110 family transposase [Micromonospora maris]WSK43756.1 IS110 family transposase [Micromonospora maris]
MAAKKRSVIGGVDTHRDTHHAAIIDNTGGLLDDAEFPATAAGYADLLAWMRSFGRLTAIGVEGTGSYGAGLARHLTGQKVTVVEVDRPDRRTRRSKGKSDPIDAVAAARATLAGTAMGTPKTRTGPVEAIRALRVARQGAVKARTAAINQMRGLVAAAPEALRAQLTKLSTAVLINRCAALTIDPTRLADPEQATAAALAGLARRVTPLTEEITTLDRQLTPLVRQAAPHTSALFGVGTDVAAQLLTTAGDNPDRLRSEAALAHLCGAAPIPASSGRVRRHRLHRGGDRGANHALHTIALCRLRYDQRTRAYQQRRITQGLSKQEILRCLKRYIVRDVYTALRADFAALTP